MINDEEELIAELLCIVGELGGEMKRFTTHDNTGKTSKKITIEYDITYEKKKWCHQMMKNCLKLP